MSFNPAISKLASVCPSDWDVLPMPEVTFFQEGPGILAKDFRDSGVPLLRLKSVEGDYVTLNGCNFLDPAMVKKKWDHFRVEEGDLLISTSASLGRVSEVTSQSSGGVSYQSWFIDFDPVRAKAKGLAPAGMDEATAALFPDSFDKSALGAIPNGWAAKPLDSIASYLNGLAMQKFPPESETEFLPVIKIAQLRAGHTVGSDRASARLKSDYVVRDGDVLFSWSGTLEVEIWCGGTGALNQHLFKVSSEVVPKWFYYLATRHHLPAFRQVAASKATTMGHIQRGHLSAALIAVPPVDLLTACSEVMSTLIELRTSNALEIKALSDLRDTLLPRLISGKLRIPEAEELIEAVAA